MRITLLFCLVLLVGCSEETDPNDSILPDDIVLVDPLEGLPLDEAINKHIKSTLDITATEKYTYEIFRGDCDGDDSLDIVVAVNLLDRAMTKAIASGQLPKYAETGYMGHFNYIVYIDGFTRKFDPPRVIPSSPHAKLAINFEQIRTPNHMDFTVDYRIKDAGFRDYYTVMNGHPRQILQTPIFSGVGEKESEAFKVRYETGSYSMCKDIVVYKGSFENIVPESEFDIYEFNPDIVGTDQLERRWFFNEQDFKYYTQKAQ